MEALLIEYAKKYGIEQALEMLGLNKSKPKYTFGMPFTNKKVSFNPMNMIANQGLKALIGGSSMGMALPLMAGGLGLGYLRNPLREGSMNFNPYLKDQMTYLSKNNMLGTDQSGLTKYGPDSVLAGQNVISLFGTNDYIDQLNKYKNKYEKTMPKERLNKLNKEIADYELDQVRKELKKDDLRILQNINAASNNGGDSGSFNTSKQGKEGAFGTYDGSKGRKDYGRGGIASL
tara:strand:- start:701 stop:1396 length:696 start_codon:yes stop_codon:yes gene_type:complete